MNQNRSFKGSRAKAVLEIPASDRLCYNSADSAIPAWHSNLRRTRSRARVFLQSARMFGRGHPGAYKSQRSINTRCAPWGRCSDAAENPLCNAGCWRRLFALCPAACSSNLPGCVGRMGSTGLARREVSAALSTINPIQEAPCFARWERALA